jgi:ADP-heptose:LPS heptosyltransferase
MDPQESQVDSRAQFARYLVVAPQGLGDSLEATPFLAALKAARPHSTIDVAVTRRGPKELFEGLDDLVSEVIFLPYWDAGLATFMKDLLLKRWRPRYEMAFLMYPAARAEYQLLMRMFPSRRRYSHRYFDPSFSTLLWLNTDLVPIVKEHNVLQNLRLLSAAGIQHDVPDRYTVPSTWIAQSERRENTIALHVGTITHDGLGARRWPLERFIQIAARCAASNFDVALLMGPSEREETLAVKAAVPETRIVEGTLAQIARFLSTCSLVLTNDSGIGHLAAGVGAPVISLFGPTAPWRHGPYGPNAHALRPSTCPPCFDPKLLNTECALNINHRCLREEMTVEIVAAAMNDVLTVENRQTLNSGVG